MAVAPVVLRPNVDVALPTGWTVSPSGTAAAATDDEPAVDTTYAQHGTGTETAALRLGLTTFALPALSQIRSVTFRYRVALPSYLAGDNVIYRGSHRVGATSVVSDSLVAGTVTAAIQTLTGAARTANPSGGAWTQADIDALEVELAYFSGTVGNRTFRLYEAYADVSHNEAPVAVVTAPAEGGTAATTRPTVSWTYTDPESDVQERYRVKVFTAAQVAEVGFAPETSQPTWDSGEVFSSATSAVVGTDLLNGTAYRAYAKVADYGSNGRYGAWDWNAFTVSLAAAAAPTLTATADNALGRVALVVTPSGATGTQMILEYSDDGINWRRHRAGDRVAYPAGPAAMTVYDYEARSDAVRYYRAKSTDATGTATSLPSATQAVTPDLSRWWLKDPIEPALNRPVYLEGDDFTFVLPEDVGVFAPLGRAKKLVVSGQLRGAEFGGVLYARGQAEYEGLDDLRRKQRTVLLQNPIGDQWYIRFTSWEVRRSGMGILVWRIGFSAVEVDPPTEPEAGLPFAITDVSIVG